MPIRAAACGGLLGALLLVVASTALFVYRYLDDKAHYEKWKDYEECGI